MPAVTGIIRANAHLFKGYRMIRIESVSSRLSPDICGEILIKCSQNATAAEFLVISSGKVAGELKLFLIIRGEGSGANALKHRLDLLAASVIHSLESRNISCRLIESPQDCLAGLSEALHGDMGGICFFPPESVPGKTPWYVPGQYNSAGSSPVNFGELADSAAHFPGVMLSIQAAPAALSKAETDHILKQLSLLRSKKNMPIASASIDAYEAYIKMNSGNEPVFEISFCGFGTTAYISDLAARVSLTGLQSCRFSFRQELNIRYLYYGNQQLMAISRVHGHAPAYRGRLTNAQQRLSHLCRLGDITAALTLPTDPGNISGVKINRVVDSNEPIPEELTLRDGIHLGKYHKTGQDIHIPVADLTRHGFFTGKPGSGKTVFALGLLNSLNKHKNKYPFLAFEPAKKEYRSLLGPIPELKIYTPGRQDIAPMQLNIFLPPKGVRLEQYQPMVETIFTAAISMPHPLDIIFPQVISRAYVHYGWRPDSTRDSEGVRIFGMHEFIREFRRYTRGKYSKDAEAMHNIESGGIVRLNALLDSPTFDTNESIDIEELLTQPAVIEMDALTNNRERAIVMSVLLSQIMLYLQQRGVTSKSLKNMILIDEAHLLLDQDELLQEGSPASGSAVLEMLQNMTLILRAYGTSLMFGDQSAARLTSVILSNVNLKMMFRMDSLSDRQILAQEALMTPDMISGMVSLPAGQCYMHCDKLSEPVYLTVPNAEEELKLNKEISDAEVRDHMNIQLSPPFYQCRICPHCKTACNDHIRSDARFIAKQLMENETIRDLLEGFDSQQKDGFPAYLKDTLPEDTGKICKKFKIAASAQDRLVGCTRVHLIRELLLQPDFRLDEDALITEKTDNSETGPK